jgi:hypothetical protein
VDVNALFPRLVVANKVDRGFDVFELRLQMIHCIWQAKGSFPAQLRPGLQTRVAVVMDYSRGKKYRLVSTAASCGVSRTPRQDRSTRRTC